jgi:hypothetical protein
MEPKIFCARASLATSKRILILAAMTKASALFTLAWTATYRSTMRRICFARMTRAVLDYQIIVASRLVSVALTNVLMISLTIKII